MALEISKQLTVALTALFKVNVLPVPFCPELDVHWYTGLVPPLVALALKLTCEPWQIGLAVVCDIVIAGGTVVLKLTDVVAVAVQLFKVAVTV